MKTDTDGWNGTKVTVGSEVKVHAPGFGRGLTAKVLGFKETNQGASRDTEIEITRTTPKNYWKVGNRTSVGVWWLEAA